MPSVRAVNPPLAVNSSRAGRWEPLGEGSGGVAHYGVDGVVGDVPADGHAEVVARLVGQVAVVLEGRLIVGFRDGRRYTYIGSGCMDTDPSRVEQKTAGRC